MRCVVDRRLTGQSCIAIVAFGRKFVRHLPVFFSSEATNSRAAADTIKRVTEFDFQLGIFPF
jgi:hypothetical protein